MEAKRIATGIFNLINDNPRNSPSILSQLGIRTKFSYFSSVPVRAPDAVLLLQMGTPLTSLAVTSDASGKMETKYKPYLSEAPHAYRGEIAFAEWWNRETIFVNSAGAGLTRMNLTFALRSKDGGAHYDEELPATPYLELKQRTPLVAADDSSTPKPRLVQNAHLASMRQIAWELEKSFAEAKGIFTSL